MSKLRIFQIDAFTGERFAGNSAAVVPLEQWLDDGVMQAIAAENNLSETAFFVPDGDRFHLRWFTPTLEVKLCGHATLASAFVLFHDLGIDRDAVHFDTRSGALSVTREGGLLVMDFPTWTLEPVDEVPRALIEGLGVGPVEVLRVDTRDNFFVILSTEAQVRAVDPDFAMLETLHPAGVVVSAPGSDSDCASRYFAPSWGIPEDPATGSIHCGLTPYWSARLGKTAIFARQVSARGAELHCELAGSRTRIGGRAVKYLEGWIEV